MGRYGMAYPRYNKLTITQDALGLDIETLAAAGAAIGRAIATNTTINTTNVVQYADNGEACEIKEFKSGTTVLNVDDLSLEIESDLLGKTITGGKVISNVNDAPPYVRWGYMRSGKKGTAKYYRGIIFMKASFGPGNESDKTKGESLSIEDDTVTGSIKRNRDGDWKAEKQFVTEREAIMFINSYLNIVETLAVASAAGTAGSTLITVAPVKLTGSTYKYKAAATVTLPAYNDTLSGWTTWDGAAAITATTGHDIVIAEVGSSGKVIAAGKTTVVSGS